MRPGRPTPPKQRLHTPSLPKRPIPSRRRRVHHAPSARAPRLASICELGAQRQLEDLDVRVRVQLDDAVGAVDTDERANRVALGPLDDDHLRRAGWRPSARQALRLRRTSHAPASRVPGD
eukprot:6420435-Prymnesium_polylepis.1